MDTIDEVILNRLRHLPPNGCTVVPGSTPIIAFGRFRDAKIATVSLNPSYREFDIVNGELRFHTLTSLGIKDYTDINIKHTNQIIDYCERYFERPGIVYNGWFDKVSNFLKKSTGYDYYNGTACHLDLSQWATSDVWNNLNSKQKRALTSTHDLELLTEIIKRGNVHTLLLNGKKTSIEIYKYLGLRPQKVQLRPTIKEEKTKYKVEGYMVKTDTILGKKVGREITFIGWNTYLKYAGDDAVEILSKWVSGL
jgi:hypothetical protein